jgi:molybdenum cofactor biosynthesis enzyme MoaA
VVDYLPIKLDIENVSRCNFRCTMCVVAEWPKGQRAEDMRFDDFRRLIDEQYGLVEIKLQGIGEPLMQRGDEFFEMIRYARSKHIWVRTTTNASLLHLRDNYKKLVDTGVNEIQISIDGATKDVFEGIRVGSVFGQVAANCKLINGYCREKGVEVTKMWTVVQQANRHQLSQLVDLGQELGFTNQVFSLEAIGWGLDKWNERNASVTVEDELGLESMLSLLEKDRAQGRRVAFWHTTEKYRTDSPSHSARGRSNAPTSPPTCASCRAARSATRTPTRSVLRSRPMAASPRSGRAMSSRNSAVPIWKDGRRRSAGPVTIRASTEKAPAVVRPH